MVETGADVEYVQKGDLVSVPFNIACGRYESASGNECQPTPQLFFCACISIFVGNCLCSLGFFSFEDLIR